MTDPMTDFLIHLGAKFGHPKSVLDIGAHQGTWTESCQSVFPDARYTLVEANGCHAEKLRAIGETHIALLSDEVGDVDFYQVVPFEDHGTGASMRPEVFSGLQTTPVTMWATMADLLFHDRTFDLIKIDVQGCEDKVIRGGINLFRRAAWVISEVSIVEYNEGCLLDGDFIAFMRWVGFEPYRTIQGLYFGEDEIQRDIAFKRY